MIDADCKRCIKAQILQFYFKTVQGNNHQHNRHHLGHIFQTGGLPQ